MNTDTLHTQLESTIDAINGGDDARAGADELQRWIDTLAALPESSDLFDYTNGLRQLRNHLAKETLDAEKLGQGFITMGKRTVDLAQSLDDAATGKRVQALGDALRSLGARVSDNA